MLNQNNKFCHFCHEVAHPTKKCPLEINVAPLLKKKVGSLMEYFVANNIKCPECNKSALQVIGNDSPSLDIICNYCDKIFEVKSKCLSSHIIPNDIVLPHGSYFKYLEKRNEGLNLIIVIYGIDRYNKNIIIREILYASNNNLKDLNINVSQNENNTLSTIFIKNKLLLNRIVFENNNIISFYEEIETFKKTFKNLNK